jgi:hypothetical protein
MSILTVGQAAREISSEFGVTVRPKVVSDALYAGALRDDLCPVVGGRRLIPRELLPNLVSALRRAGKLAA